MKKILSAALLSFAALCMSSSASLAISCDYNVYVKRNVADKVVITKSYYKYVDDFFGLWWEFPFIGFDQDKVLDENSDVYEVTESNITATCDHQTYGIRLHYYCGGTDENENFYSKDTGTIQGGHYNNVYIIITGCGDDLLYREDSWPETDFTGYISGYIYGTNSNANNKCLQAQTDSFSNGVDVHVWDQCINGSPRKNRQWKYELATGYIRNIDDPSYCLHKATNGYAAGDNIHMWKCDEGPTENKQWEYNVNGQNLIRSKANPNFCIFRGGANVGDAIHLWSCNPNNNIDQNGRWNITWGGSG